MHPHGIEILDRTNDDAVVGTIPHHFHLEFFPTDERFFDQDLVYRRHGETALSDLFKLFPVVSDPAAAATQSERRPDNVRERSDLVCDFVRVRP